jgi:uncharacterized protein with FMN-binding domain
MKRTPIVATATAAGVIAVLAFHTSPPKLAVGTLAPPSAGATGSESTSSPSPSPSPSPTPDSSPTSGKQSSPPPGGSTATGATRTVDGPQVYYDYGTLSVSVTVYGKHITKVGIASLNDTEDVRSEMIDDQAIPILEQEAVQAQSANIQSVSGASYTSAGFKESLQAALRSAGI